MAVHFHIVLIVCALGVAASESQVMCKNSGPAVLGGNVTLQCEFLADLDVLQVTWQKKRGKNTQNMVTYSEKYGINIDRRFESRVSVLNVSLAAFSIKIVKLEKEDEACYVCLFNVYPNGAFPGEVCLADLSLPPRTEPTNTEKEVKVLNVAGTNKDDPEVRETHSRAWRWIILVGIPLLMGILILICYTHSKREPMTPRKLDKAETGDASLIRSIKKLEKTSSPSGNSPNVCGLAIPSSSHENETKGTPKSQESQGSSFKRRNIQKVIDSTITPMASLSDDENKL